MGRGGFLFFFFPLMRRWDVKSLTSSAMWQPDWSKDRDPIHKKSVAHLYGTLGRNSHVNSLGREARSVSGFFSVFGNEKKKRREREREAMELSLSGNALKTFNRSITCLARVGSELIVQASPSQASKSKEPIICNLLIIRGVWWIIIRSLMGLFLSNWNRFCW